MMAQALNTVLLFSLAAHVLLMIVSVWRVWRGENVIDRLMGLEVLSTLILAVLVLLAMIQGRNLYIDIALALAALGFIGIIALARYVAEEKMF